MMKPLSRQLLAFLAFAAAQLGGAAADTRPNIILVMPDDAGYGDYACLENLIDGE